MSLKKTREKILSKVTKAAEQAKPLLRSAGNAGAEFLKDVGEKGAAGATAAWKKANDQFEGFKKYVESEEFEQDLDEVGKRLGLKPEQLHHDGNTHWERTSYKLGLISTHTGLDSFLQKSPKLNIQFAGVALVGMMPEVAAVLAGAHFIKIAFHCYQVYLERKKKKAA